MARLAYSIIDRRHEHWILASMLLVLHAALDADLDSAFSAALMTAHLGLFFLWQPIWQKDQRLQLRAVAIVVLFVGVMLATLSWWSVFAWLIVLIGIVAGRSFSTRRERYVYLISLACLISELLVHCTAMLFLDRHLSAGIDQTFRIGLYLLPVLLFAIPPVAGTPRDPFPVDFFRGITFALMTALIAVLSVLANLRYAIDYPLALVASLMVLGALLFFLSWITAPGTDNAGLLSVWEKSVLNIGTPFETWLGNIANLAAQRGQADDFLEAAIGELYEIPWIAGVEWRAGAASGIEGHRSRHHLTVDVDALRVTLFTERSFSAALLMHCHLLVQVLGHFYVAKQRENKEANEAHLRAIYETGARVTHDIKNLLQALNTMAGTLQASSSAEQDQRGLALLKTRLPDIARRLQRALDKLQRPQTPAAERVAASTWWEHAHTRCAGAAVAAELADASFELPAECFDSVLDNLVDNARQKIEAGAARTLEVRLAIDDGGATLSVSDDGEAIPAALAGLLFAAPVASRTGLGIGLYQAARQAELAGCALALAENRDGAVRFTLHCPAAAADT